MQVYTLEIRDRNIRLASDDETLVRTSTNVDTIELLFMDAEWLGYDLFCALAVDGELVHEKHIDVLEVPYLVSDEPTEEAVEWLARAYVVVPDEVLEHAGALGVTVHGFGEGDEHIITALSRPLQVMDEGDGIGDAPTTRP